MSHEIICKYLEYSRKTDIKFKGNKSWDMIKWNAYENLYISEAFADQGPILRRHESPYTSGD